MTEKQKDTFGVLAIVFVTALSLTIYTMTTDTERRYITLRALIDIDAQYLGTEHPNTLRKTSVCIAYENEGYENLRLDLEKIRIIGDRFGKTRIIASTPNNPFIRDLILGKAMHPQYRRSLENLDNSQLKD